jgi:hypothetical protein
MYDNTDIMVIVRSLYQHTFVQDSSPLPLPSLSLCCVVVSLTSPYSLSLSASLSLTPCPPTPPLTSPSSSSCREGPFSPISNAQFVHFGTLLVRRTVNYRLGRESRR